MSKSVVLELAPSQAVACCSPLARQPMTSDQAGQVAPMLKALATRSGCGLVTSVGGPRRVQDEEVEVAGGSPAAACCRARLAEAHRVTTPGHQLPASAIFCRSRSWPLILRAGPGSQPCGRNRGRNAGAVACRAPRAAPAGQPGQGAGGGGRRRPLPVPDGARWSAAVIRSRSRWYSEVPISPRPSRSSRTRRVGRRPRRVAAPARKGLVAIRMAAGRTGSCSCAGWRTARPPASPPGRRARSAGPSRRPRRG